MRSSTVLALFVAMASTVPARTGSAATLYVDRGNGSCSDGGPGSTAQPLCTLGAATARATAGTTVVVASGTYPENVTIASSGTSSAPIVFMPASGASVTVSGQTHGFTISGRSWIIVEGFTVSGTSGEGLSVSSSSNVTLSGNHVTKAGQPVSGRTANGIRLSAVTDSLVAHNTVDHNTDMGIFLTSGTTRVTVASNDSSHNAQGFQRAAAGIDVFGSTNNVIEFNRCHDNEDSGIDFRGGAKDNLVVNNVAYLNGDHGIDVLASTGLRIVSNSVYKNVTSGINVEGSSGSATLANNVSVDNGINSPRTKGNIRVDSTSTSGTTLDYDIVFLHQSGTTMVWGSSTYSSLGAFRSATGREPHGRQADPLWRAPDAGDLHLSGGSPAIDSANAGASGESLTDADGGGRVDDPGTANTGAGPRTYDDRGAYEYRAGGGSTEYVGNPGFESGTSGWHAAGSATGVTLGRVAGGHSGSWAAKLANTAAAGGSCTLNDSPNWLATTSAGTYTGSLWVRGGAVGATLRLRFRESSQGVMVGSAQQSVTLGSGWQQVTVSYAPTQPGATTLDFNAYISSAPTGTCFFADDASITLQ